MTPVMLTRFLLATGVAAVIVVPSAPAAAHDCSHRSRHWDGLVRVDYLRGFTDSSGRHRHEEYRWYPPLWAATSYPVCSGH